MVWLVSFLCFFSLMIFVLAQYMLTNMSSFISFQNFFALSHLSTEKCWNANKPKKLNKLAAKHLICWCFSQDAFETAARAEGGLSLDGGNAADAKELEDEVGRSKYHHSVCVLKPIRSTSKYVLKLLIIVHFISVSKSWRVTLCPFPDVYMLLKVRLSNFKGSVNLRKGMPIEVTVT